MIKEIQVKFEVLEYLLLHVIFGKQKIKLESFMIFKSYAKEPIDLYGTNGIRLILNPKLILENCGYRIDLTFIQCGMI